MNLLLDADNVLLEWLEGFTTFLNHTRDLNLDPKANQHFDLVHWAGLSDEENLKAIEEFNHHSWEFGCLPPIPDAQRNLNYLHFDARFKLSVITACSTNPQTVALRHANLYHHFGDIFEHVHCVELGQCKKTHLASYPPSFWIEDNYQNACDGIEFGHTPIVLEYPHNKEYQKNSRPEIIWAKNWNEIRKIITGVRK